MSIKQRRQSQFDGGIFGSEDSTGSSLTSLPGVDVALVRSWVNDPDVAHTAVKIVFDLFLGVARPIVAGKNLDYQERWRAKDLLLQLPAHIHAHIRYSETGALALNTLLGKTVGSQGGFLATKQAISFLCVRLWSFSPKFRSKTRPSTYSRSPSLKLVRRYSSTETSVDAGCMFLLYR